VTPLAERHAAQMRSRQVPLGFAAPPELGGPSGSSWARAAAPASAAPAAFGASSAFGAPAAVPASGTARDWARNLRDQTRASRAEEPRTEYQPGGARIAEDYPTLPSLVPAGRGGPPDAAPEATVDATVDATIDGAAVHDVRAGGVSARMAEAVLDLPPLPAPRRFAAGTGPVAPQSGGFFSQLRYLGQLDLTYLACEGDGELVLIDQHAAHERVELARLRERHACGTGEPRVAVQSMLFPVTLEATPSQLELVARVGGVLAQVGFEVEPFGAATLAVKAVPAGIRHGDPAQLLRRLLADWAEAGVPGEAELEARLDGLLGAIACHSVVRAGDRLGASEAETLLRSLDGVDLSLPAPHGRAVLLRLPLSEIGRRFGR